MSGQTPQSIQTPDTVETRIGTLSFRDGAPSPATAAKLYDQLAFSRGTVAENDDGSIDLYFGPECPAGVEDNWLATVPGKGWFPILRLYSPKAAFFDKSWRPSEIEVVS